MNLTAKELAYLAPSFNERTAISLFSNINDTPDGTEHEKLSRKGIIQGGAIAPEALGILMDMANPGRCARLIVKTKFFTMEKYTYWNNGRLVLAENNHGEMMIGRITDLSKVTSGLVELFSMSEIRTADVSVILPVDEMLVLLAVIDRQRKRALKGFLGEQSQSGPFTLQDITGEISDGFENGLVRILVSNYKYEIPAANEIPRLLANLAEKKLLLSDSKYQLAENIALLADHFLIPDSVLFFETVEPMKDGSMAADGGLCVTAGIHDIITFTVEEGHSIGMHSTSASQMLASIRKVLECPMLMEEGNPIRAKEKE